MPDAHTRAHPSLPALQAFLPTTRMRRSRVVVLLGIGVAAVGSGGIVAFLVSYLAGESLTNAITNGLWGVVGGAVSGVVAVASIPALRFELLRREHARMLEAANPMHPLLREMMMVAPGTYAHSLSVGGLAETAAATVGADALLALVGAYYHDIGKMRRPQFFFENQAGCGNPHDEAKPSLSALIISAHVHDGLDLAEEYGLPRRVQDIIREHHGTSVIRYFYHKAAQTDAEAVENDFRYHGGKPTSAEAAIVMLADASEAAVRALGEPTAEKIGALVRTIAEDKAADGQFDESGLSAEEISAVVISLTHGLVTSYHTRCAYPRGTGDEEAECRSAS